MNTPPETIPISIRGAAVVAALGDDRVLLAGAKQSWLWNGRTKRLTPLPRIGPWRAEYGLQGVYTGGRLLLAGTPHPNKDAYATLSMETSPQYLLLYDPETEQVSSARLRVKRNRYNMVALNANQVLILGGTVPGSAFNDRAWQVELVSWDRQGNLKVEMLPGMNDSRRDGQAVRLPDGQVMAIGGLRNTTEFFDPSTRRWRYGPPLEDPFTRGQIASFRDGSILLIQRSIWLWRPGSESWQNLGPGKELEHLRGITAISDHEVIAVAGKETRIFDVRDKSLRVGPDLANPHSDVRFVPLSNGEWHVFDVVTANDDEAKPIEILRFAPSGQRPSGTLAVALSSMVAARLKDGRVLLAGNESGRNNDPQRSRIVDPSLPGFQVLNEGNNYGRPPLGVFTLPDSSVLIVGGEKFSAGAQDSNQPLASQRWSPATDTWRRIDGPAIRMGGENGDDNRHSLCLRSNGDIVYLDASPPSETAMSARVQRWSPETGRNELLGVLRKWRSAASLIELRDGRLAVMGGMTQSDIIAVDKPCTDCSDDYMSIGRIEEAATTEVFDPASGAWTPGPRSAYAGGQAVRFGDGRIVKITAGGNGTHMEISDSAFRRWQSISPPNRLRQLYPGHLLPVGQRLVILGHRFDKDTPALIWNPNKNAWQEWTTELSLSVQRTLVLDEKHIFILGRDTARSGNIGAYLILTLPP